MTQGQWQEYMHALRSERRAIKRARVRMLKQAHAMHIANKGLQPALAKVIASGQALQWRAMRAGY